MISSLILLINKANLFFEDIRLKIVVNLPEIKEKMTDLDQDSNWSMKITLKTVISAKEN